LPFGRIELMTIHLKLLVSFIFYQSSLFLAAKDFEKLTNNEFGVSLNKPKSWVDWDNPQIKSNIEKFDFTDQERIEILKNHKGSILLFSFAKERKGTIGNSIIPIVQVYVRANSASSYSAFEKSMLKSLEFVKQYFQEFEYLDGPGTLEISGIKSFWVYNRTKLIQNGREIVSKSKVIAVPRGHYFIQISFTDGYEKNDCQKLFAEILQSVKIEN
jgi:hypothetical protein